MLFRKERRLHPEKSTFHLLLSKACIFVLIFVWLFSGWPQIFHFPPDIGEALAATSFVGSCENSGANGADVTLTLPTTQEDDLVIVAYTIGDDDTDHDLTMLTADYNEVADLFADDTDDTNLGVFWKIMGATPDTEAQVEGRGQTDSSVAAVCMVFRGVDTTTPMDVTPATATGINTMHPDPPSVDHNNPSGVWTVLVGGNVHLLGGAGTYTFPTGYTTDAIDRGQDDTNDTTVGMAYRSSGVSDPENPGAMTHSGTDNTGRSWAAVTLALRPAVVNLSPDAPTLHDVPFDNEKTGDSTPDVEFTGSDPDGTASMIYQIQIDDDYAFGSPLVNCESDTSCAAGAGSFTNTVSGGDTSPFNEGERIRFTPTTAMTSGVTYYWRVRAEDDSASGGSGSYGSWATIKSVTYISGTSPSEWTQTTDEQFDTGTLSGTQATGSNSVQMNSSTSISKQGTDTTGTDTASPLTFSHTLVSGSNRVVVCAVGAEFDATGGDGDITSATYGGQAMTEGLTEQTGTTGFVSEASIFYLLEADLPANGANTFSVSVTQTTAMEVNAVCVQYQGVEQVAPSPTDTAVWSSGASISNTISPPTNDWVVSAVAVGNAGTLTHGQNQVEIYDADDASSGFAMAELQGANGETSLDSTFSGTINRGVRIAASWSPAPISSGTIMSPEIDFDWVSGQSIWGDAAFATTETNGNVTLRVYYTVSTACDTIVPNSALSGNSTGFDVSASPIDISGLTPVASTYNRICLQATLTNSGGTPFLNDWTVTWATAGGTLSADIVNGSYVSVSSPTMGMNTTTFSFPCQTVTGSFGTSSQQIYISNDGGANDGWTLTVAAQATTDVWDSAGTDYDFNDPTGSGCTDGADAGDTVGGQMTIDPSGATLAVGQCGSCTTSNISKGSSSSFNEGTTDAITLLTATASSDDTGDWTLQGVSISQKIPAEQPAASDYTINMVLTVTAS